MVLRRNACWLLAFILLLLIPQTVIASWNGGYRVSLDGYVVPSLSENEYLSFYGIYKPFGVAVGPSVQVGLNLPTVRSTGHDTLLSVGIGSGLFIVQNHPFDRLFRRDSALVPRVDTYLSFDLGNRASLTTATLVAQPISLFFGDKLISVMGVQLVHDVIDGTWGWGIRLFEITHYLW